jgi:hypothetical protein
LTHWPGVLCVMAFSAVTCKWDRVRERQTYCQENQVRSRGQLSSSRRLIISYQSLFLSLNPSSQEWLDLEWFECLKLLIDLILLQFPLLKSLKRPDNSLRPSKFLCHPHLYLHRLDTSNSLEGCLHHLQSSVATLSETKLRAVREWLKRILMKQMSFTLDSSPSNFSRKKEWRFSSFSEVPSFTTQVSRPVDN